MPRPQNKPELLELSEKNYERLLKQIEELPEDIRLSEFPTGTLNRTVTDVLAHLHEWHLMMLSWYTIGMKGEKPVMPAEGFTWKDLPTLNRNIWIKYKDADHKEIMNSFKKSYRQIRALIERHTDKELFTKKKYPWTGSTSLGAYLVSATSSHYDWAFKLIKKSTKTLMIPKS